MLERHAARHALVKRPRKATAALAPALPAAAAPPPSRPRAIPAEVEREVRLRDRNRCLFPLDAGGVCGSTHRLELDHVVPVALGGLATAANLRVVCAFHNGFAARLGEAAAGERGRRRTRGTGRSGAAEPTPI